MWGHNFQVHLPGWEWGWITAQGVPPGPANLSLMSSVPENAISLRLEEAQSTPTHTLGLTSSSCETTRVRAGGRTDSWGAECQKETRGVEAGNQRHGSPPNSASRGVGPLRAEQRRGGVRALGVEGIWRVSLSHPPRQLALSPGHPQVGQLWWPLRWF